MPFIIYISTKLNCSLQELNFDNCESAESSDSEGYNASSEDEPEESEDVEDVNLLSSNNSKFVYNYRIY